MTVWFESDKAPSRPCGSGQSRVVATKLLKWDPVATAVGSDSITPDGVSVAC
jgi:hypothetical protein